MGGRKILKKVKPTRSARKRKPGVTREALVEKAMRARCWTCERDDQPIASLVLVDSVMDAVNCVACGQEGVCRCVREGTLEHRWQCFDCGDAWGRWAALVLRVLKAVREKLPEGPRSVARLEKLRVLLVSEDGCETPHLDRWLEKLAVAA